MEAKEQSNMEKLFFKNISHLVAKYKNNYLELIDYTTIYNNNWLSITLIVLFIQFVLPIAKLSICCSCFGNMLSK